MDSGYRPSEDITMQAIFEALDRVISAGAVINLWIALPCESVSLFWTRRGVSPFRSRSMPDGVVPMPRAWAAYVMRHNTIFERGCHLATSQFHASRTYWIENPADLGQIGSPLFRHDKRGHVPLWLTSPIRQLTTATNPSWATTLMCRWFGRFHKPTTIMSAGPGAATLTYRYNLMRCITRVHVLRAADVDANGKAISQESGEYPQLFCAYTVASWFERYHEVAPGERLPMPTAISRSASSVHSFLSFGFAPSQRALPSSKWPRALANARQPYREPDTPSMASAAAALKAITEPSPHAVQGPWRSAHQEIPGHWDEAADANGLTLEAARDTSLSFVSRRRAIPELPLNLVRREFSQPSSRVTSDRSTWHKITTWPTNCPARPIAASQLWLDGVYDEILDAIAVVQGTCIAGSRDQPMSKVETRAFGIELMSPFGRDLVERGGSWDIEDPADVAPLAPYSDDDPVPPTVSSSFFIRWHRMLQWTDGAMLQEVTVTGAEARSAHTKATIVMGHHGGLRANFAPAAAAVEADLNNGFTKPGRPHPWVIPSIMVARNCVKRSLWRIVKGKLAQIIKWRVTTDDTIEAKAAPGEPPFTSRNNGMDSDTWFRTGLPNARSLPEAMAILRSVCEEMGIETSEVALERIAAWALDLCHAYRMLSVQRAEWGQQCFIWFDGVRLDLRCLFGTASMVEFFQRVSTFVLAVGRRRIREYDEQHPYSAPRQAWRVWRDAEIDSGSPRGSTERTDCTAAVIYIDDALGLSVHGEGEPITGRLDSAALPVLASIHVESDVDSGGKESARVKLFLFAEMSRGQTHLSLMSDSFREAGWGVVDEKNQLGWGIDELGMHCTSEGEGALEVPEAKRQGMIEDIKAQQPPPEGTLDQPKAHRSIVETLQGRCLHIAQAAPEANAYLAPMYRVLHGHEARQWLTIDDGSARSDDYQRALSWWRHALESGISTPLAPLLQFPSLDEEGVSFLFTDAAREARTGHGGFTMIRDGNNELLFINISPAWDADILEALRTNKLSMPAGEGIGAVIFADTLAITLPELRYLVVFTDSSPVVAALNSGNSDSPQLNAIVRWLFDRHPLLQLLALHQPGKRNGAADSLSRDDRERVLKEAAEGGARAVTIDCHDTSRALATMALSFPQRGRPPRSLRRRMRGPTE